MAGIPPLMGFFAKYLVLASAVHSGHYFVSIVAILASVVSAAYYLRVVRVLYFDPVTGNSPGHVNFGATLGSTHAFVIASLTAAIMLFGLDPTIVLNTAELIGLSLAGY
jgi:NADH-ubiquinone oxidoreductase chain 2